MAVWADDLGVEPAAGKAVKFKERLIDWFVTRRLEALEKETHVGAIKTAIHWLLGNGHVTTLIGYAMAAMQYHDGGSSWESIGKMAGFTILGRLVPGGTIPGLPVK
jgi:hypothetical protein